MTIFDCLISIRGYNCAAVIQTIKSSDIDDIENYVKSSLAIKLENSDNTEKSHFFGGFAKNPKEFTFSSGERRLIERIIDHVREVAKSEGLIRFKETESEKKEIDPEFAENANRVLCQTSIVLEQHSP